METLSTCLVLLLWRSKFNVTSRRITISDLSSFGCGTSLLKDEIVDKVNNSIAVLQKKLGREELVYGKCLDTTRLGAQGLC